MNDRVTNFFRNFLCCCDRETVPVPSYNITELYKGWETDFDKYKESVNLHSTFYSSIPESIELNPLPHQEDIH